MGHVFCPNSGSSPSQNRTRKTGRFDRVQDVSFRKKNRSTISCFFAILPGLNSFTPGSRRCGQGCPAMPVSAKNLATSRVVAIPPSQLKLSRFSRLIYGDSTSLLEDILPSVRDHGILVPLAVVAGREPGIWEVI